MPGRKETINTIPVETLTAYRDHGQPASNLEEGTQDACRVLEGLVQVEIDLDILTQQLEDEGVAKNNLLSLKLPVSDGVINTHWVSPAL
jgi:transaldolase